MGSVRAEISVVAAGTLAIDFSWDEVAFVSPIL